MGGEKPKLTRIDKIFPTKLLLCYIEALLVFLKGGEIKMSENEELSPYQKHQTPKDEWTAELYAKHGLGETPSLEEIEPIALVLLSKGDTALEGAELVLGREVTGDMEKEPEVVSIISSPLDPGNRLALLLLKRTNEDDSLKIEEK